MERKPRYTLIENARLIDPDKKNAAACSLLFVCAPEGSRILDIGREVRTGDIPGEALAVYNAKSHYMAKGLTDLSVNTGEPGGMHRETLKTCAAAAAAGGVTTLLTSPDTNPPANSPEVIEYIKAGSAKLPCRFVPAASVFKEGKNTLSDIGKLMEAGAGAVCTDGSCGIPLLLKVMEICKSGGYPLIVKCCDPSSPGNIAKGRISGMLKTAGIPSWRQDIPVYTLLRLASDTGCPVHLTAVSTAESVKLIREAKEAGAPVTCGTCPQYFTFFENDLFMFGSNLKLMPPLGRESDRAAIISGIADGTIDCISSDHTPQTGKDKSAGIDRAPFGMTGVQTLFAASFTKLVAAGQITLPRLIALLSANPASVLHRERKLAKESAADIIIFSTDREYELQSVDIKSKSQNTPLLGSTLRGEMIKVFSDGKSV